MVEHEICHQLERQSLPLEHLAFHVVSVGDRRSDGRGILRFQDEAAFSSRVAREAAGVEFIPERRWGGGAAGKQRPRSFSS